MFIYFQTINNTEIFFLTVSFFKKNNWAELPLHNSSIIRASTRTMLYISDLKIKAFHHEIL